jgi:hypothetical protein
MMGDEKEGAASRAGGFARQKSDRATKRRQRRRDDHRPTTMRNGSAEKGWPGHVAAHIGAARLIGLEIGPEYPKCAALARRSAEHSLQADNKAKRGKLLKNPKDWGIVQR